jgi:AcrR family transcriptional regulator
LLGARRAFARLGYAATTNQMVALEADVATGTIYHYFPSKQAMFLAVLRETRTIILTALDKAALDAPTLREQMRAMINASLVVNAHEDTIAQFTAAAEVDLVRHPELRAAAEEAGVPTGIEAMQERVASARARGELAPDLSDAHAMETLGVIFAGLAQLAARTDDSTLEQVAAPVLDLLDGTFFRERTA